MHWLFNLMFIGFGVAAVWHGVVVHCLLQRLNRIHAAELRQMGVPDAWDLVTSFPWNWPMQWRFMRSLWRGRLRELEDPTATRLANTALLTWAAALGTWIAGIVLVVLSE